MQPLVSIIIPTFNRAEYVIDAVRSALQQTYEPKEIIVVDDESTDQTDQLVAEFPQIKYFYKNRGGQASARNFGLRHAKGDIIASLDSDDIWEEDFLETTVSKIQSDSLDFVFTMWNQHNKDGTVFHSLGKSPFLIKHLPRFQVEWIDLKPHEVRALFTATCPSPSSSFVITRKALGDGWDERVKIGDDWCMQLNAVLSGYTKGAFNPRAMWTKRVNHNNVCDQRDGIEVYKELYIHDSRIFLDSFGEKLTSKEISIFNRFYIKGVIGTGIHSFKRDYKLIHLHSALWESVRIDFLMCCGVVYEQIFRGIMLPGIKKCFKFLGLQHLYLHLRTRNTFSNFLSL